MRKFISTIAGALMMFALSAPLATIAKSAEFFTIGTGGPTGVYFQTGNAICKMLHKFAISSDHGRKKELIKRTDVQLRQLEVLTIILDKSKKENSNLV